MKKLLYFIAGILLAATVTVALVICLKIFHVNFYTLIAESSAPIREVIGMSLGFSHEIGMGWTIGYSGIFAIYLCYYVLCVSRQIDPTQVGHIVQSIYVFSAMFTVAGTMLPIFKNDVLASSNAAAEISPYLLHLYSKLGFVFLCVFGILVLLLIYRVFKQSDLVNLMRSPSFYGLAGFTITPILIMLIFALANPLKHEASRDQLAIHEKPEATEQEDLKQDKADSSKSLAQNKGNPQPQESITVNAGFVEEVTIDSADASQEDIKRGQKPIPKNIVFDFPESVADLKIYYPAFLFQKHQDQYEIPGRTLRDSIETDKEIIERYLASPVIALEGSQSNLRFHAKLLAELQVIIAHFNSEDSAKDFVIKVRKTPNGVSVQTPATASQAQKIFNVIL